jgi:Voltage gated chloride channel
LTHSPDSYNFPSAVHLWLPKDVIRSISEVKGHFVSRQVPADSSLPVDRVLNARTRRGSPPTAPSPRDETHRETQPVPAAGHGTDAAISAVHHNPRGIRFRAVIVKIVASALTIGSRGSGGREGPTPQISAGFVSLLARKLELSPADARTAVVTGISRPQSIVEIEYDQPSPNCLWRSPSARIRPHEERTYW